MPIDVSREVPIFQDASSSKALRWLTSVAAAIMCGIWVFDVTARAALRESRLMEMARPACSHSAITNEELRDLVRHELEGGSSKKDALGTLVALCLAKPQADSAPQRGHA
jgi:hypothetical protein